MRFKGQGALEYLLMIGAGVAIAGIVLYFVFFSTRTMTCDNFKQHVTQLCAQKLTQSTCLNQADVTSELPGNECEWDAAASPAVCKIRSGLAWNTTTYCQGT
ncbi:MAG: class III signal peptide-containing protein [Candidatus Diapherotrites archaeon]